MGYDIDENYTDNTELSVNAVLNIERVLMENNIKKEKCYHMTRKLREILNDAKKQLRPLIGENSKHVNDTKSENIGISYSLGLEGIVATNAMFRARYQYDLLENQTDRDVTLDDMFSQNITEQENKSLGGCIYLTFNETEQIQADNKERDIADPKTIIPINVDDIKGIVLKNKKTGEIKYDRESIIRYAISKTNINDILNKLNDCDKPFMNMEGYGKTNFSFKDYVKRYYEEIIKDSKILEFINDEYILKEINVYELLKLVEKDKTIFMQDNNGKIKGKSGLEDCMQDSTVRTSTEQEATKVVSETVLGKEKTIDETEQQK